VFNDPYALFYRDRSEGGEERWQAIGLAKSRVVLLVAHTTKEKGGTEVVRLISARRATKKERQHYGETRS